MGVLMASLDFQFRFDKALQAAGLFLRLNGGRLKSLKLLKLLYLADRESLAVEGDTITGDRVRAMLFFLLDRKTGVRHLLRVAERNLIYTLFFVTKQP